MKQIVVGTRGSKLAQWQTNHVIAALKRVAPELQIEVKLIQTSGDKDQATPLAQLGGRGVFTKEIEIALLNGEIDLAVHSLKDLPTDQTPERIFTAIIERADPRDCIVSRHGVGLMQLPSDARIGTASARRAAQVLALRPNVQIVALRGNVDTRLGKAQSEEYDAIVLAAAGILRLGRENEISEYLSLDQFLPDPGQGALAVQIRTDDTELASLLTRLDHAPTRAATTAERAFLAALGGGCALPIAAFAELHGNELFLRGLVSSVDGRCVVRHERVGSIGAAQELGRALADELLRRGAAEILGIDAGVKHLPALNASPLRGKQILITRARALGQAEGFAEKLRARGAAVIEFPSIEIAPLDSFSELDAALRQLATFDWVVFTSMNGVRATIERMQKLELPPNVLTLHKIAAIGPATARALEQLGLRVDFMPTKFLGEQIARELSIASGQRALLLRADIASDVLERGLAARGVVVTNVAAYRTVAPSQREVDLRGMDAVTFTSSSTVRNFITQLNGNLEQLREVTIACIGPVTAATARELGLRVDVIAAEYTVDGLIDALVKFFQQAQSQE